MAGSDDGGSKEVEGDQKKEYGVEEKPKKKRPKLDPVGHTKEQNDFDANLLTIGDYESPVCTRCQRDGERCVRGRTKIKFRHGSSARYDSGFSKDQTWLKTSGTSKHLKYVDETGDVAAFYTQGYDGNDTDGDSIIEDTELDKSQTQQVTSRFNAQLMSMGPPSPIRPSTSNGMLASPLKRQKTNDTEHARLHSIGSNPDRPEIVAASPSFSFLNFPSPSGRSNLAFSPAAAIGTPFDYTSILGLTEQDLNVASLQYSGGGESFINKSSPAQESFLPGLVKQPSHTPQANNEQQTDPGRVEAVLLRHFIENLAIWFDLCDPEKHFEFVVPQRARSSPTLMNAILTASARHLTRLDRYKNDAGLVNWNGHVLPELNQETALHYHNKCIKDLIRLSMDPKQVQDENLLAACIILRFYEEVDSPLREEGDGEVFLRVTNTFVNHQVPDLPALPHSSPLIQYGAVQAENGNENPNMPLQMTSPASNISHGSIPSNSIPLSSGPTPRVTRADGLRQAAFWVGFRQEIYNAFMKQRTFTFPLSRCEAFRTFDPAEDAVWADRLIIFCADVLEFCHGTHRDPQATRERWLELKQYEKTWSAVLPSSFEPIFFKEPDRLRGEVFPEIWYLADCHVTGIQHVELARILLAVYDPTRPKLGPGHFASMKALSHELKAIVLRLCGIALSNRRAPPGIVTACMGIAMCGEHFEDRAEQQALLSVLNELETYHAWPVGNTVDVLKSAWGWH